MDYNLKSESEVKEYLKNLGIEYRFGCYSEKNPEICHLLADFLETIKKDYEKAARVYRNNCDEYKYGKSCLKFGTYLLFGKGTKEPDFKNAYGYFEKGCSFEEPYSCFNQGLLLITKNDQHGIQQDMPKGMELLAKACAAKNATACYYLSGLHISNARSVSKNDKIAEKDKHSDIAKHMEKAFQFALEGCNLGNMYSCANVSQMYARGHGTEKDEKLAEKYKNRTLELQEELETKETLAFGVGLDPK